jgi:hypothetical protein
MDQNGLAGQDGNQGDVRRLVENAVAQAVQMQLSQLQSHIIEQVLVSLPNGAASTGPASESGSNHHTSENLLQAVASIHAGSTQKEILRALLDSGSGYCCRIALFVVKSGAATGWQSRGFGNPEHDAVKDFSLDLSAGPAAHGFQYRVATRGNIAEMGAPFIEQFNAPADERVLVLPLTLKDKLAALVYADGGDSGKLDSSALELLVIATSAWLEVISLRKHSPPKDDTDASASAAAPVQAVSSFSDPFASHTPRHIPAPVSAALDHTAEIVGAGSVQTASAAAAPAAATDPLAGIPPADADTHRKAQRFARLLVDEIKLYNQAKVAEGRRNKDLYDRLKEDIDKSRESFQKRYGNTVAANADYFQIELLRSLAEDDIAIMGSNFRR